MDFQRPSVWSGLTAQSFWVGAGVLWFFSAAVSAMEPPKSEDSRFYGWLYRFTHLLAANLDRAFGPISSLRSLSRPTTESSQADSQTKEQ